MFSPLEGSNGKVGIVAAPWPKPLAVEGERRETRIKSRNYACSEVTGATGNRPVETVFTGNFLATLTTEKSHE